MIISKINNRDILIVSIIAVFVALVSGVIGLFITKEVPKESTQYIVILIASVLNFLLIVMSFKDSDQQKEELRKSEIRRGFYRLSKNTDLALDRLFIDISVDTDHHNANVSLNRDSVHGINALTMVIGIAIFVDQKFMPSYYFSPVFFETYFSSLNFMLKYISQVEDEDLKREFCIEVEVNHGAHLDGLSLVDSDKVELLKIDDDKYPNRFCEGAIPFFKKLSLFSKDLSRELESVRKISFSLLENNK